jgi:mannose-6-phosphate isomerase-like protein (cupin superfamily)
MYPMADPVLRFEYPGGDAEDGRGEPGRKHFYLFKTDRAVSEVQVFDKGVKNRLHHHGIEDGVWIVLGGKATFYGEEDKVMGELEPFQGLLIPAGTKYWFESTGEEPLQILRVDYNVGRDNAVAKGATGFQVLNSYGATRWSAYADEEHQSEVAQRS